MDAVQGFLPPPPEYTEAHDPTDAKPRDLSSPGHGPWLLRRTSVHTKSRPADQADDRSSARSSVVSAPRNDEKGAIRNLLGSLGRPLSLKRTAHMSQSRLPNCQMHSGLNRLIDK